MPDKTTQYLNKLHRNLPAAECDGVTMVEAEVWMRAASAYLSHYPESTKDAAEVGDEMVKRFRLRFVAGEGPEDLQLRPGEGYPKR